MDTHYLIFVVCMASIFSTTSGECPNGWTRYDASCYRIFNTALDWPEAQFACEEKSGFLAVIETKEESANIHALVKQYHLGDRDNIWIGLADMRHEGVWVWENSKQNVTFSDWDSGEPNSYHGQNEDCVELLASSGHKWADTDCMRKLHYLCERVYEDIFTISDEP